MLWPRPHSDHHLSLVDEPSESAGGPWRGPGTADAFLARGGSMDAPGYASVAVAHPQLLAAVMLIPLDEAMNRLFRADTAFSMCAKWTTS